MNRKLALTTIIFFILLCSLVAGIQVVDVAKANFFLGPALGIESPISQMVYTNTSVPLKIVAHVANPTPEVVCIIYSLDDNPNVTISDLNKTLRLPGHIDGSQFYIETLLNNLTEGNHTLRAYSQDSAGSQMSASVEFVIDTQYTRPLSVLSPKNMTYTTTDIPLTYVCREDKEHDGKFVNAVYMLDGIGSDIIYENTTLTDLSVGNHTINVVVWTENGFFSDTICFTIRNVPLDPSFSMPEEYLNYTITTRNDAFWAIVDGTYPIYCSNAGNVGIISMAYPTPPNTINMLIKLNETQLSWTNFTEQFPDALHHTLIGDWAMIETSFNPSEFFVLQIHYEHPIMLVNGGYQFLYDLNISPYLSASSPTSTAYFSLKTENARPDLQVFTVPSDDTRNELEYSVQNRGEFQEVTFAVTSEYDKPLPGDVLVTFSSSDPKTQEPLPFSSGVIAAVIVVAVVDVGVLVYFKKRRRK